MTTRRDFLKTGGAAAGALALGGALRTVDALAPARPAQAPSTQGPPMDGPTKELLLHALNAAQLAGAQYADARIARQRQMSVGTREQRVTNVSDNDSLGCGVRVLVDGTWGFAATRALTKDAVAGAAREAAAIAKANRVARDQRVELAPAPRIGEVSWKSHFTIDPWSVPIEEKVAHLLKANAEAMKAAGVRYATSSMNFVKEEKNFASTDGNVVSQVIVRSWTPFEVTAIAGDGSDFASRANVVPPIGRGWEAIVEQDLPGKARQFGEEAAEKLKAKSVDVGRWDLILHPSHLRLTIHEAIGHPTELDRAMGYEANYAGTSYLAPPMEHLGKTRLGKEWVQFQGNRSEVGGLATVGYDDEGVKPDDFLVVKDGVFNDYQTTREQANWLRPWYERQKEPVRSHGCSYAQTWGDVQFQRMPNVSLLPGERDIGWDEIIADTDRGIAIVGHGSYSIDQQRYNAQFGGQLFYEVRGGKVVGMLKDVAYQIRTPEFWNSIDMIGGRKSYELWGSFFDGKGQPGQVNAVSHGCPPARFRGVNVINTGRRA